MRRDQLEHLIRAAGDLLDEDAIIVIGSQAILASMPSPSDDLLIRSMEADLLPLDDPNEEKATLIDGVLGAGSMFDDAHGIHADGVGVASLIAPEGWRDRLVEIQNENTSGVRGLCLEAHDLVISKLAAGREKDLEFCAAAARSGLVSRSRLRDRLTMTEVGDHLRRQLEARIDALPTASS